MLWVLDPELFLSLYPFLNDACLSLSLFISSPAGLFSPVQIFCLSCYFLAFSSQKNDFVKETQLCVSFRLCWISLLWASSSCGSQGFSLGGASRRRAWALGHRLTSRGTQTQLPFGTWVFLDQGSNTCPLLWQVGSYPLYHQRSSQKNEF